jgi:hypothetical protein
MAGKIFISYRRDDDTAAMAARIGDRLASRFGKANVFIDVENLFAGQRFAEELAKALATCDVLIAVIGHRWMDLLNAKSRDKKRDYVREEIGEALQRGITVIPVVGGRQRQLPALPSAEDLPDDIRDLVEHQEEVLTHECFDRDVGDLIEAITVVRRSRRKKLALPGSWMIWAAGMSLLAIIGIGVYFAGMPFTGSGSPPVVPSKDAPTSRSEPLSNSVTRWFAKAKAQLTRLEDAAQSKREQEDKAVAGAKAIVEGEHRRAEAEDKRRAEEAKVEAEAEAKRVAEEAKVLAETEAKRVAEEEAARRDPALSVTPGSGQTFHDLLANGPPCPMCPEMVVVPAGSFTMGSPKNGSPTIRPAKNEPGRFENEGPPHTVTIAKPFAVGKFHVTVDQFAAFVADRHDASKCYAFKAGDWLEKGGRSWR